MRGAVVVRALGVAVAKDPLRAPAVGGEAGVHGGGLAVEVFEEAGVVEEGVGGVGD